MKTGKQDTQGSSGKRYLPPPITLVRPEYAPPKKNDSLTMKLRSNPTDANSQTYELTVKFFKTGSAEEWLLFQRDLNKIIVGQNITAAPSKYSMARLLLSGEALAVFDTSATEHGNENNANFILTLQSLTTHIFPQRALAFQKRYMRRYMRKPREMTIRAFAARVAELNAYLLEFPPFDVNQDLDDTEIMDILENGVPNTWSKNMVLQGFDPMENTASDFVAFCERHEFTEGTLDNSKDSNKEAKPTAHSKNSSNDAKSRAKPSAEASKNKKRSATDKWCDLHQTNGHSTAECKVVQSQITKMRSSWEPVRPKHNTNSNSTFNKNPGKQGFQDNKFKSKELMSLVEAQVKKILKVKRQKTSHETHNTETNPIDLDLDDFENIDIESSDDDN
jgi:hypothetical protein